MSQESQHRRALVSAMNQPLTTIQGKKREERASYIQLDTAPPSFSLNLFLTPVMEKKELKQERRKSEREDPSSCTLQILKSKPDRKDIALEEK